MSELTLSTSTAVMSGQSADAKLSQATQQSNQAGKEQATQEVKDKTETTGQTQKADQGGQQKVNPTDEANRNNQGQLQGEGILVNNQA